MKIYYSRIIGALTLFIVISLSLDFAGYGSAVVGLFLGIGIPAVVNYFLPFIEVKS